MSELVSGAGSVRLLSGGDQAFPPMLAAIEGARREVHLEVYSFHRDRIGTQFIQALGAAARRGVRVRVIVDGWGSDHARQTVRELRAAGCQTKVYNPLLASFVGRMRRDHRKLLLVDDEVVFLGGLNISDEFTGSKGWADLALEIHGPACANLGRRLRAEPRSAAPAGVRILLSSDRGTRALRRRYLKAIGSARERITLVHSYFMPDRGLIRSIRSAARRGVAVTLLVPQRSDVPLVKAMSRTYYRGLLKAGVRIFEWRRSVLHAKAIVVDRELALIGSFNFDPWSLLNLEVLAEVRDPKVAEGVETWVAERLHQSNEVVLHQPGLAERARLWLGQGMLALVWSLTRLASRLLREPIAVSRATRPAARERPPRRPPGPPSARAAG
jgi:cardiolipin synthase